MDTEEFNDELSNQIAATFVRLSQNNNTQCRFCKATPASQYWMCYSEWIDAHQERIDDEDVRAFRDSLTQTMTSSDIAYVLQFETDSNRIGFLSKMLMAAVKRETSPEQIEERRRILNDALDKPFYEGMTVSALAKKEGGHFINRLYSAMRSRVVYLQGDGQQYNCVAFSSWCSTHGLSPHLHAQR